MTNDKTKKQTKNEDSELVFLTMKEVQTINDNWKKIGDAYDGLFAEFNDMRETVRKLGYFLLFTECMLISLILYLLYLG